MKLAEIDQPMRRSGALLGAAPASDPDLLGRRTDARVPRPRQQARDRTAEHERRDDTDEDDRDDGDGKDARDKPSGKDGDDNQRDKEKGDDDGQNGSGGAKKRWPLVVLLIVAVLVVAACIVWWFLTRNQESTDDAYTEGNAVSIAPQVSGYVVARLVDDNTFVHAGDLMLCIDPRQYMDARDQAQANLDLAEAQLASARIDLQIARVRFPSDREQSMAQLQQARANQTNTAHEYRRQHTVDQRATTQSTVDQATAQFISARATTAQIEAQLRVSSLVGPNIAATQTTLKQRQAQVEQARASLAQAELNLSYTEIRAPMDGTITRRNVDVGTYLQPGQQVFYVTSPVTWVVANFKEIQLNRMRVGQRVAVHVDAYPALKLKGYVQSIQQGAGARFTTFPSENATGNFVKIVRRVPVKIVLDRGIDPHVGLPLGLSVEPTVELR